MDPRQQGNRTPTAAPPPSERAQTGVVLTPGVGGGGRGYVLLRSLAFVSRGHSSEAAWEGANNDEESVLQLPTGLNWAWTRLGERAPPATDQMC